MNEEQINYPRAREDLIIYALIDNSQTDIFFRVTLAGIRRGKVLDIVQRALDKSILMLKKILIGREIDLFGKIDVITGINLEYLEDDKMVIVSIEF